MTEAIINARSRTPGAAMMARWSDRLRRAGVGTRLLELAGIGLLLVIWQLCHYFIGQFFPAPLDVFDNIATNFWSSRYFEGIGLAPGGYADHILATTTTVLVGLAIGAVAGVAAGYASALSSVADQIISPLATILGTVPILVASPFLLIWFGPTEVPKLILVGFYSAVVLHVYAMRAVQNVNPAYVAYARTLGADGFGIFREIIVPASLPELFGGLRTALGAAWGFAVIGELLGSEYGVGRVITATWSAYDITSMMAGVVVLGVVAVIADALLAGLRRMLTRWR